MPPLMMITIPGLRRLARQNAAGVQLIKATHAKDGWVGACGTGLCLLARSGFELKANTE